MSRLALPSGLRLVGWGSYAAQRLQRAGIAGLVLACVALLILAVSAWVLEPARSRAAAEAAALQARLDRPAAPPRPTPAAALLAALPPLELAPRFVQAVQDQALRHGVLIERTEYRTPDTGDPQLKRLQVIVPAQGSYRGLKRWMAELLVEFPACAVDELTMLRAASTASDAPDAGPVQARVSLSLYMREAR